MRNQRRGIGILLGADADPGTPEIDVYVGSRIINTGQAWVPAGFRAQPTIMEQDQIDGPTETQAEATPTATSTPADVLATPPVTPKFTPAATVRILRIEPTIRGVTLAAGESVRLNVAVYGRQDIRDDSLASPSHITVDWSAEAQSGSSTTVGEFGESVPSNTERVPNGQPDDVETLYTVSQSVGSYVVTASLEPGVECLGKRDGETDENVIARCSAEFEATVTHPTAQQPTPVPPRNPSGEIPSVIVDDAGTNYEVMTPEGGGEFQTERCSFRIFEGSVNNEEIIGVSVTELDHPRELSEVDDPRFMTAGLQCRISAVAIDGTALVDYLLRAPGEICMPLPDTFRPVTFGALVGSINADATLTALSSKLFLVTSVGSLKVCGNISSLSATTTVALRVEAAGELPPTPHPAPVAGDIDTGASRLSMAQVAAMMLIGIAAIVVAAATWRRSRQRQRGH